MLRELRIENLLLIERAELRFGAGLNAITGETGAGKTVLAHSLDLLMGGKPRSGIVRPGAEEAWVEGAFEIPAGLREDSDLGDLAERLPAGDELVLARRVSASGRSSAFVAGRSASAADLRALGSRLLAFYGQHEHRKLTLSAAQAEILDGFAGPEHLEVRARYRDAYARATGLRRERDELAEREGARERDIDLLRFELDEIEEAAIEADEVAGLEAERDRLRHSELLREAAGVALLAIAGAEEGGGGAVSLIGEAEAALGRSAGFDPELDALTERGVALALEASDLGRELHSYVDRIEADPERLEQVETRLASIDRLLRKHGGTVEAVLAHAEHCRAELDRLERASERGGELERELAATDAERAKLGERLSARRRKVAPKLEAEVASELAQLAMDGARLEVALDPHPDGFGPGGHETIELRVATNPGMPIAPLGDAASGGELSRVMLALSGLGPGGEAETLVFDEIDAGVGGKVARRVGERLQKLGAERQVVCITHLAQVASLASTHFRVEKESDGTASLARVEAVSGDEQLAEIVRMLGADHGDEAALGHARELLAA
jgi:DNA repair protein RecN (Recombination protein N)